MMNPLMRSFHYPKLLNFTIANDKKYLKHIIYSSKDVQIAYMF